MALALTSALALAFFLIPAAQAAAGVLTVEIAGSGEGEVSSVGGFGGFGSYEGVPPIVCTGPPTAGECESEMSDEGAGFEGIALHSVPAAGSVLKSWTLESPDGELFDLTEEECRKPQNNSCFPGRIPPGEGKVIATFEPAYYTLTVVKHGTGAATAVVLSSPFYPFPFYPKENSIYCGSICSAVFPGGSTVTLIAYPRGTQFEGWTGCTSTPTPRECTVLMSGPKTVHATFKATQTLTVEREGSGAASAGVYSLEPNPGIFCSGTGACSKSFTEGTTVTLIAYPRGTQFEGWTGCTPGASPRECTVPMSEAKTVKAKFTAKHSLSVTKTGAGAATAGVYSLEPNPGIFCSGSGSCSAPFLEGTTVILIAYPRGTSFTGWSGCTPLANPKECEVTISSAKSVEANFD